MGYDSKIWSVLFWLGTAASLIAQTVTSPAEYGIPPLVMKWIGLIGLVCLGLGGKLGQSYLGKSNGAPKVNVTKLGPLLLVLALLVPATSCALKGSARHQTTVAAVAIGDSLIAATDVEREHWRDLGIAEATHKAFQGRMVKVLEAAKAIDQTILAWPKGAPAPMTLKPLILALKDDLDAALALVPASPTKAVITTKLAAVWSLVGLVLGGA